MACPPAYDEVVSRSWRTAKPEAPGCRYEERWNIREVVAASQAQHVASVVEQLFPEIKSRAQRGYARTELILIPSDEDNARSGELVGIEQENPPIIIQFQGSQNTTAFWSQDEVVIELKRQLVNAVANEEEIAKPTSSVQPILQSSSASRSSSWFGRQAQKESKVQPVIVQPKQHPVSITVSWDDVHCRSETEYGLLETKRAKAIFVAIDVQ